MCTCSNLGQYMCVAVGFLSCSAPYWRPSVFAAHPMDQKGLQGIFWVLEQALRASFLTGTPDSGMSPRIYYMSLTLGISQGINTADSPLAN